MATGYVDLPRNWGGDNGNRLADQPYVVRHQQRKLDDRYVYVITADMSLIKADGDAVPLADCERAMMAMEMNLLVPGAKQWSDQDWWIGDLEVTDAVNRLLRAGMAKITMRVPRVEFLVNHEKWETFKTRKVVDEVHF